MITSKLTSKSQTTVPQSVRRALNLKPGDLLAYEISEGRVILTRARTESGLDDPFGSFDEWRGKEDEEAYASL
jgi:antitoxin PrlF